MKIYELFSKPRSWTRFVYARDIHGIPLESPLSKHAVRFCLTGAVDRCYRGNNRIKIRKILIEHLKFISSGVNSIVNYNDNICKNRKEIVKLTKELDI